VFVLLVILVQAALYWWATLHCSTSALKGYSYPGGGSDNLVPADSLLVEQAPRWWGASFINIPADSAGLSTGASTGVYFRTWGPLWNTYTYEDVLGMKTFVVRDRPLAIGGSHKLMRCDGEGPSWVVSEGSHWLMNGIRSLFGMYTSRVYNVWKGDTLVAVTEKLGGTGQSHKQLIFRDPNKAEPFASAFLKDRHYHGEFDDWFVQTNKNSSLPNFVPNSVAMLMAFATAKEKSHSPKPSEFLEDTPSAAALAVEVPATARQQVAIATSLEEGQGVKIVAAPTEPPLTASVASATEQTVSADLTSSGQIGQRMEESMPAEERI